jgi:hypothetical protein
MHALFWIEWANEGHGQRNVVGKMLIALSTERERELIIA